MGFRWGKEKFDHDTDHIATTLRSVFFVCSDKVWVMGGQGETGVTICQPSFTFSTINCLEEKGRNIGLSKEEPPVKEFCMNHLHPWRKLSWYKNHSKGNSAHLVGSDKHEHVPAHVRGLGSRWSLKPLPPLTILWFYSVCIFRSSTSIFTTNNFTGVCLSCSAG